MNEIRACATSGILGYGFPEDSLRLCMEMKPHFIACDAGSTDAGPYYLGSGKSFVSRVAVKRDLKLILLAAHSAQIPVLIGSAGGSGCNQGVNELVQILEEITDEEDIHFKAAVIQAEIPKDYLKEKVNEGRISTLGNASPLTIDTINKLHRTVGMMGPEPFIKALENGANVIIAGRSTDASVFAAFPIYKGVNPDYAWHAAKIIECGAAIAVPRTHDCIMACIRDHELIIQTANPDKTVPWKNVAAHTMYENVSPFHLLEPGGMLDTTESIYEQIDERSVKVTGSSFVRDHRYTVKLEGVEKVGYRTICIAGLRDPILLSQLDEFINSLRKKLQVKLEDTYGKNIDHEGYTVIFRKYGHNAVMGENEQEKQASHEIGLLLDVIAEDQLKSETIMAALRTLVLHSHFDGRLCTSGNAAFPFSPPDIPMGEVYGFVLNHVVEPADPYELFPIQYKEV